MAVSCFSVGQVAMSDVVSVRKRGAFLAIVEIGVSPSLAVILTSMTNTISLHFHDASGTMACPLIGGAMIQNNSMGVGEEWRFVLRVPSIADRTDDLKFRFKFTQHNVLQDDWLLLPQFCLRVS